MRKHKIFFILLFLLIYNKNVLAENLNELFLKLKNSDNLSTAVNLEKKIWNHWIKNGSNEKSNIKMYQGIQLLNNGKFEKALNIFLKLCEIEPKWSEPFNKVATIKFLQKDYNASIFYIKLTLQKEPRHFGAISGLIQIYINLKKYEEALKNIDHVSKIHPFIGIKKLKPFLLNRLNKREL